MPSCFLCKAATEVCVCVTASRLVHGRNESACVSGLGREQESEKLLKCLLVCAGKLQPVACTGQVFTAGGP